MGLPQPEADELGDPVWSCTSADVSKAYRRLSVVVHPDKNPGEEARTAFDQLNQAHKALKDIGQLVGPGLLPLRSVACGGLQLQWWECHGFMHPLPR